MAAGDPGINAMIDVTMISTTATGAIHFHLLPRFHEPCGNASPIRQRRKIGTANDRYRPTTPIVVTAKNATGTGAPLMSTSTSAGAVTISAQIATRMTALNGTFALLSLRQWRCPGTAPSRLNAKIMRLALVMQATVQKNCAIAEMPRTVVAQLVLSASVKIVATAPPPSVTASTSCTANRQASSRIQPPRPE